MDMHIQLSFMTRLYEILYIIIGLRYTKAYSRAGTGSKELTRDPTRPDLNDYAGVLPW